MTECNSTSNKPSKQTKIRKGDVFPTGEGCFCTVVEYINSQNVVIKFNDNYQYTYSVRLAHLLRGAVKNPYRPSLLGIGYLGVNSDGLPQLDNINNEYSTWDGMIRRCYDPKYQEKYPSYKGCVVTKEWHNYRVFQEWINSNKYCGLGYCLDKDVLKKGNKVYSPETCVLIPHDLNTLLLTPEKKSAYPTGVVFNKNSEKFVARVGINGKNRHIGVFDCPEKAHKAYVIAKECHVKEKALEWKELVDIRVYDALMSWTVSQE